MQRILFLCHGNICRSPMAEMLMKELVRRRGIAERYGITSAAVSREEIGNDVYPPAKRELAAHGIPCEKRAARLTSADECARADYVLCMDRSNLRNLARLVGEERARKARMLMEFAGEAADVADPWYTGDFERTYRDVLAGCEGLLNVVERKE